MATLKFLKTRFCTLIKWHVIFPLIAFKISFLFVRNCEQRSLHELNEVNPFLCKLIGKAMESYDLQKDFIKDISLCSIWKCVLKILNFTHSRRRVILDLKRAPSFEKQFTIFFFFLNMHILKTSNGWISCQVSIGWMDELLGFEPWGNWESLGVHASSSGLFIEGNLRAHALSWTNRFSFWIFFKWKM